ncbi:MAG: hypothetical protein K6B67_08145 [Lachnospiraceae bacterium]|nr:hypothetical protein [Lachnospiraceae bacterium]
MEMKKLELGDLNPVLDQSIDELINAVNSKKRYVDCEMSEVLADINQCESCKIIDSHTANLLRNYYIRGGWTKNE